MWDDAARIWYRSSHVNWPNLKFLHRDAQNIFRMVLDLSVKLTINPNLHDSTSVSFLPLQSNSTLNSGNIPDLEPSADPHGHVLQFSLVSVSASLPPTTTQPAGLCAHQDLKLLYKCDFRDMNEQCPSQEPNRKTASLCRLQGAKGGWKPPSESSFSILPRMHG